MSLTTFEKLTNMKTMQLNQDLCTLHESENYSLLVCRLEVPLATHSCGCERTVVFYLITSKIVLYVASLGHPSESFKRI